MENSQAPPPECATASQDCQDVGAFLSASQPQYHAYAKGRRLRPLATHSRPSLAASGLHIPSITALSKEHGSITSTSASASIAAVPATSVDSGLAGSLGSIERKLDQVNPADTDPIVSRQLPETISSPSLSATRRAPRPLSTGPPRAFSTRINKSLLDTHPSFSTVTANKMDVKRPVAMRRGTPCASREMEPTTASILEEPTESTPVVSHPTTPSPSLPAPAISSASIPPAEKVSQAFHAALTDAQTRENTMINTRRLPPNLDAINKSLGLGGPASDANAAEEEQEDAEVDADGKVHWRHRLASHRTISQATMTTSTSMLEDDEDESDDSCAGNTQGGAAGGKDQSKDKATAAVPVLLQVSEKPTVTVAPPTVTVSEPLPTEPSSYPPNVSTTAAPVQVIKLIPDSLLLSPPQGPPEPILTSLPPIADLVDIPLNTHPTSSTTNIAIHTNPNDGHQEMHIVTAADTTDHSYSSLSEFPTARAVAPTQPPPPTVHTSSLDACPSVKVHRPPASKLAQTIHGLMHQRKQAAAKDSMPGSAAAIDRRDSALARSNSSVKPGMRETVARILQSTLSRSPASSSSSSADAAASDAPGGGVKAQVNALVDTLPAEELAAASPNASVRSIASSRKSRVPSNASSRTKRRWWARLFGGVGGGIGEGVAAVSGQGQQGGGVPN